MYHQSYNIYQKHYYNQFSNSTWTSPGGNRQINNPSPPSQKNKREKAEKRAQTTRECHGYGKTRGFEVTGLAGTGTVVDFDTPWHTAYPCCGIMGIHGYITVECEFFFIFFLIFNHLFFSEFILSHCDTTKFGSRPHVHLCLLPHSRLTPTPIPL